MTDMNSVDVAIFGCGYIGSRWVKIADSHPAVDTVYAIDTDPSTLENISEYTVNFVSLNLLRAETGTELEQAQYRVLAECDIWIIGIGYQNHLDFISVADSASIPKVLVEKPVFNTHHINSTRYPEELDSFSPEVYTNYVELSNPHFTAVADKAIEDNAQITTAFHWRGKNSINSVGFGNKHPYEHPIVKDDLVHDISELYFILKCLNQSVDFSISEIGPTQAWNDLTVNGICPFSYFTDESWASITYTTSNGEYTVQGGFSDELPRRFFVWIDELTDCAYYGNTLSEPYFDTIENPVRAYKIGSAEEGAELKQKLQSGSVKIDKYIRSLSGSEIPSKKSQHTFTIVLNELLSQNTTLPTLHDAYQIETIAEKFYRQTEYNYGTYY